MDDLLSRAPEEWAERIARRLSQRLFQEQPEVARRLFGRAAADRAAEEGASLSAEEFEATLAASVAETGELWAIHSGAPLRATGGAQRPAQMARELAPFVENLLTDCVSPLKVYDYLAAGLPVVSTPMSELRGIPYCHLASGAAAFCAAVAEASQERVDPAVIERFCRDHSWARRVARLRQELGI